MRTLAAAGLVALTLSAGAAPALAGTTTVEKGFGFSVRVSNEGTSAGDIQDETNTILVEEDSAGNLLVTDAGQESNVVAGQGCFLQTTDRVSCPPDPSNSSDLEIYTGRGDDGISINLPARPLSGVATLHLYGGGENDRILGGPGAETLEGDGRNGNGAPLVEDPTGAGPQEGNDRISGGGGPDTLLGQGGRDYLNGASASATDTSANTLDGGSDRDYFDGGNMLGADRMTGGSGDDAPLTGSGLLFGVQETLANGEQPQVRGGDTVSYGTRTYSTAGTAGVVSDLDGVRDDGTTGENDQIDADVEALVGTIRDDRLTGSGVANRIEGRLGTDTLVGGAGPDEMRFREGVPDTCFVPGAGDLVDLDLTDPPATLCTPKTFKPPFTATINASPADETMPYVKVASRVRRRGARRVIAKVRCARSAQKRCKGSLSLSRSLGRKAAARRPFRAKPGRTARVAFRLPPARVAALKRSGRVVVTSVHQGLSKVGPTTTVVARRF